MAIERLEERCRALQEELDNAKTKEERNRMGQFSTPFGLAVDIVRYAASLIADDQQVKFIDPAFGTGSFFSALLSVFDDSRIKVANGYEIDAHYGDPAKDLWKETRLRLITADFTKVSPPRDEEEKFNLIVCNPPYVRHHHIQPEDKKRLRSSSRERMNANIGGLAGLYSYFVILSHEWMANEGVAAWLIPSEFMDVGYGRALKDYLLTRVVLLRVHLFNWAESQFGDALVSSAVVWFRNSGSRLGNMVELTWGGSISHPEKVNRLPVTMLQAEQKWTPLVRNGLTLTLTDGVRLGHLFTIRRGLATGDNKFFILSGARIRELGLPMEFFKPILPSARDLRDNEILADSEGLPVMGRQLFLLDCGLHEDVVRERYPALWRYLKEGIASGIPQKYLPSHRSPWYSQEKRQPAPLLCTYMGRNSGGRRPFRFILNHSEAVAPNVYLMLYPKLPLAKLTEGNPDILHDIWVKLNSISTNYLMDEGRSYGGGLHKLEPTELANVRVNGLPCLQDARD